MNSTDIYCRKEARDRLKGKGLSSTDAFLISEEVNSLIEEELHKQRCDKCAP